MTSRKIRQFVSIIVVSFTLCAVIGIARARVLTPAEVAARTAMRNSERKEVVLPDVPADTKLATAKNGK
jgi:hypothetical protein